MNRITLTAKLGIRESYSYETILRFIRQIVSITVILWKGLKFLQDFVSTLVICAFTNLNIVFQDSVNSQCTYSLHEELASHYLLHCRSFTTGGFAFLSKIKEIDGNLLNYTVSMHILLLGKSSFNTVTKTQALYANIDFLASTKMLEKPFF